MENPVVQAAQLAFSVRLKNSSDVSENTKNAQAIAKGWRPAVHALDPDRFQIEAMVTPELDQKIDVVDQENGCAYEFKVSGKNAWAEFYKDIVKVIIWNQKRKKKLSCLVFITEEKWGRPFLDAPMPRAYMKCRIRGRESQATLVVEIADSGGWQLYFQPISFCPSLFFRRKKVWLRWCGSAAGLLWR